MIKTSSYNVSDDIVTIRIDKKGNDIYMSEQASFKTNNEDLKLAIQHHTQALDGIIKGYLTLKEPIEKQDWKEVDDIIKDLKILSTLKNNFEQTIIEQLKKIL